MIEKKFKTKKGKSLTIRIRRATKKEALLSGIGFTIIFGLVYYFFIR